MSGAVTLANGETCCERIERVLDERCPYATITKYEVMIQKTYCDVAGHTLSAREYLELHETVETAVRRRIDAVYEQSHARSEKEHNDA